LLALPIELRYSNDMDKQTDYYVWSEFYPDYAERMAAITRWTLKYFHGRDLFTLEPI
jgi:hypothetical protein